MVVGAIIYGGTNSSLNGDITGNTNGTISNTSVPFPEMGLQSPSSQTAKPTPPPASSSATSQAQNVTQALVAPPKKDLPSIIKEWQPNVALITCYWDNNPSINDQGSGFLTTLSDDTVIVLTNKHVISDSIYGGASYCDVSFPGIPNSETARASNVNMRISSQGYDWGYLALGLDAFLTNNNSHGITAADVAGKKLPQCSEFDDIGANVVILGFPDYGGTSNITATQGIISGFDGSYYTTSAEISAGNSGGVAIDPDKNCYLGIPSAVVYGKYGNLGRILSVKFIFSQ